MNYNNAISTSFKVNVDKIPELTYFAQSITLPGFSVNPIETAYRNNKIKYPDNVVIKDDFIIQFLVDEDFYNWDKIRLWFLECQGEDVNILNLMSDVYVIRLDSNKNPIARITLKGAFPINVGAITNSHNISDPDIVPCDVSFAFQELTIDYFNRS